MDREVGCALVSLCEWNRCCQKWHLQAGLRVNTSKSQSFAFSFSRHCFLIFPVPFGDRTRPLVRRSAILRQPGALLRSWFPQPRHWWGNRFVDLIAAVVADALEVSSESRDGMERWDANLGNNVGIGCIPCIIQYNSGIYIYITIITHNIV